MNRKEYQKNYQRQWIAARRAAFFKNKFCVQCGSIQRLELDHIDPEEKKSHNIWSWSEERRNKELDKCQVLCYNCHKVKSIKYCLEIDVSKSTRIPTPEGIAWCYSGKHFKPINHFSKNKAKRLGLENDCKICRSLRRNKNRRNK